MFGNLNTLSFLLNPASSLFCFYSLAWVLLLVLIPSWNSLPFQPPPHLLWAWNIFSLTSTQNNKDKIFPKYSHDILKTWLQIFCYASHGEVGFKSLPPWIWVGAGCLWLLHPTEYGTSDVMWLPRPGHKRTAASALFAGTLDLGALSCHKEVCDCPEATMLW